MLSELINSTHVTGLKQSTRAVLEDEVQAVYIAVDADKRVVSPLVELCRKKGISVVIAPAMKEFGQLLNIEVDTAVAAILLPGAQR